MTTTTTRRYLGLSDLAVRCGVSRSAVGSMGRSMAPPLPDPDVWVGDRPGWSDDTVDAYLALRRRYRTLGQAARRRLKSRWTAPGADLSLASVSADVELEVFA